MYEGAVKCVELIQMTQGESTFPAYTRRPRA